MFKVLLVSLLLGASPADQERVILRVAPVVLETLNAAQTESRRTKREVFHCLLGIRKGNQFFIYRVYKPSQTTFLGFKVWNHQLRYLSMVKRLEECPPGTIGDVHTHPGISPSPKNPSDIDVAEWAGHEHNLHLITYPAGKVNKCAIFLREGDVLYEIRPEKPFLLGTYER